MDLQAPRLVPVNVFGRAETLTLGAVRNTVSSTEASQFRRVLQDIGITDHPKRIRHSEWLESSLTIPFQFSRVPGRRLSPADDTSVAVTECTTRWWSPGFSLRERVRWGGVLQEPQQCETCSL